MEHFETQAIQSAHLQPFLWLGYVDDTFVSHYGHAAERNSRSSSNTSTSSTRASSSPWRLNKTTLSPNSLMFESPRKVKLKPSFPPSLQATYPRTDRYLHYRSFHHPSVLLSVPNTRIWRAHQLSDPDHLQQELNHVTSALTTINHYPRSKTKIPSPSLKYYPT